MGNKMIPFYSKKKTQAHILQFGSNASTLVCWGSCLLFSMYKLQESALESAKKSGENGTKAPSGSVRAISGLSTQADKNPSCYAFQKTRRAGERFKTNRRCGWKEENLQSSAGESGAELLRWTGCTEGRCPHAPGRLSLGDLRALMSDTRDLGSDGPPHLSARK